MPSTAIRQLSYDETSRTLFVTFVDGDLYAYFDVPPSVYEDFRRAKSKGGFFARRVRDRYRYQKVRAEEPTNPLFPAKAGTQTGDAANKPPRSGPRPSAG